MLKVGASVQNFINNPDDYLLKVTYGKEYATLNADKKGIWTWVKARFYELLGFGYYGLRRVSYAIQELDPIPEYTPLRQAANKVIAKWNSRHDWSIEKFDQYQVAVRPAIELTLEKVLEVANRVIEDDSHLNSILPFNAKARTIEDIESRCNKGLLAHPEIYINRWIRQRSGDDNYCIPDDCSRDFFYEHIFTVIPRMA